MLSAGYGSHDAPSPYRRVKPTSRARRSDAPHDAADATAAVIGEQALVTADVLEIACGPGCQESDQPGVQRHVPVVAEHAQRDAQPVAGADAHDRVGFQSASSPARASSSTTRRSRGPVLAARRIHPASRPGAGDRPGHRRTHRRTYPHGSGWTPAGPAPRRADRPSYRAPPRDAPAPCATVRRP